MEEIRKKIIRTSFLKKVVGWFGDSAKICFHMHTHCVRIESRKVNRGSNRIDRKSYVQFHNFPPSIQHILLIFSPFLFMGKISLQRKKHDQCCIGIEQYERNKSPSSNNGYCQPTFSHLSQ